MIYGQIKKDIGMILRQICEQKGIAIIEAEDCPDNIHMLIIFSPKFSISYVMGYLKGKSSLIQSALRDSMKTAYEKFCAAYEDTRYEFGITADDVWLTWLKTGVQQAISFLENDLTQELGLCLVPLYQDFLHYSTDLWKKIGTPGIHDYDINQRRVFRREAERNFMDLFQNVSILMDKFICYGIMGGTVTNNENQLFS